MALVPAGIDSSRGNGESWDGDEPCCSLSAASVLLIKPCALVPIQTTGLLAGFPRGVPVAY